jgi:hypothetical protein
MRLFHTLFPLFLACAVVGAGCSRNAASDLSRAQADAEAARVEAASLRAELTRTRAELDALRGESAGAKGPDGGADDRKQARLVAEGFLTAITRPSVEQLHGFCTPAQRKRVDTITLPPGKVSWSIESEAIGAGGREATFKGQFDSQTGKQTFIVLVIKFADAGQDRWLVDAFSVGG